MTDVRNTDDVIDSRDVIARIEELEDERQDLLNEVDSTKEDWESTDSDEENYFEIEEKYTAAETALSDWDSDNGEELKALKALADEAEGYAGDWRDGATLIRYDYFTEYAQQLCEDIGDIPRDLPHYIEIDWEKTADNIKVDYTSVDFDGVEYWVR